MSNPDLDRIYQLPTAEDGTERFCGVDLPVPGLGDKPTYCVVEQHDYGIHVHYAGHEMPEELRRTMALPSDDEVLAEVQTFLNEHERSRIELASATPLEPTSSMVRGRLAELITLDDCGVFDELETQDDDFIANLKRDLHGPAYDMFPRTDPKPPAWKRFLLICLLCFLPRNLPYAQHLRCWLDCHDWYDDQDKTKYPPHPGEQYTCERCGKEFGV